MVCFKFCFRPNVSGPSRGGQYFLSKEGCIRTLFVIGLVIARAKSEYDVLHVTYIFVHKFSVLILLFDNILRFVLV